MTNRVTEGEIANLGTCYLEMGSYNDSVSAFRDALALSPKNADLLLMQGVAYACQGNTKNAITNFEAYKQYQPRNSWEPIKKGFNYYIELIMMKFHRAYRYEFLLEQISHNLELSDFHLVERKAQEMISLLHNRPDGHFYLGVAYLESDRIQEGIDALKLAAALNPKHDITHYNLGYALKKIGRVEESIPLDYTSDLRREKPCHTL